MSILFIDDRQLYTDYDYYRTNFDWDGGGEKETLLIYHCYWSGSLTRHHELSIKSLLITQSPPYVVHIWMSPKDLDCNRDFISKFGEIPEVEFKSYLLEHEATDTPFEKYLEYVKGKKPNVASDLFRLLALGKYGGVYFDLDILFLKDIRPLCHVEFFYQWSNQPFGNHAICRFFRNSPNIHRLGKRAIEIRSLHPARLLNFSEISELAEGVYVFPTFLFDPVWIANDTGTSITDYCNNFEIGRAHV